MSAPGQSGHVTPRMTLRPSRVAVVFDGGDDWHYWARLAIYAASQVWGGSGFILVRIAAAKLSLYSCRQPGHMTRIMSCSSR